jgi:ABC-type transport system involved in cytochrome c biogenesis permease subunit
MMLRLLFLLILFLPGGAKAEQKLDLSGWKALPVLHEGRIKPLDSFARIYLKIFSEHETVDDLSASEWLAESIFIPEQAMQRTVFQGRDEDGKRIAFNYEELAQYIRSRDKIIEPLLNVPADELTPAQSNLLELYENFILSTQLYRAMTVFLFSQEKHAAFEAKLKKIITKKGDNIAAYNDEEKEIAAQSFYFNMVNEGGKDNVLLRVISTGDGWLSPWVIVNRGIEVGALKHWRNMATAYRTQDVKKWSQAVEKAKSKNPKLKIEVLFNMLSLHQVAEILYGLSVFLFIISCFIKPKFFEKTAFVTLLTGVAANLIHILLRIYLLERPPIGTLYESVLFVALTCAAGCAFMAWKQKNVNHILLGGLSGMILLLIAEAFAAEDTMGMLVAVLNTDFWLLTHVICVTLGYGTCLLASLSAHYYLLQKIWEKDTKQIFTTIKTLALFSLLLVTVGTILGGLWADQSWGRFWGWDPKENGALLIVLWLIWILHGHLTNHITRTGFVVGMAFLSIIVILAWFGVNLLSIGLHSYGFISGIAWGIAVFCAAETIIIGSLWLYPRLKARKQNEA